MKVGIGTLIPVNGHVRFSTFRSCNGLRTLSHLGRLADFTSGKPDIYGP